MPRTCVSRRRSTTRSFRYKSLVPANNAAFRTFATNWWGQQPSLTGFTEENNHAARWDPYDATYAANTASRVQQLITLYFPNGRPVNSYQDWITGTFQNALNNSSTTLDYDSGGLSTGLDWVPGGDSTTGGDDASRAPTVSADPSKLIFTHQRRDAAQADAGTTIFVEYSTDLSTWTTAAHGVNGITIDASAIPEPGFHTVVTAIPRPASGRIFAHLKIVFATGP